MLPIHWKWNRRVLMTQETFFGWYTNSFCLTMLRLCQENELTAQALILDNAFGQPATLAEVRTPLDVNVFYTPSNITSLFQPTDREVIEAFKAYCLHQTFMELFLTGQPKL
jgi:hypothetical protein